MESYRLDNLSILILIWLFNGEYLMSVAQKTINDLPDAHGVCFDQALPAVVFFIVMLFSCAFIANNSRRSLVRSVKLVA